MGKNVRYRDHKDPALQESWLTTVFFSNNNMQHTNADGPQMTLFSGLSCLALNSSGVSGATLSKRSVVCTGTRCSLPQWRRLRTGLCLGSHEFPSDTNITLLQRWHTLKDFDGLRPQPTERPPFHSLRILSHPLLTLAYLPLKHLQRLPPLSTVGPEPPPASSPAPSSPAARPPLWYARSSKSSATPLPPAAAAPGSRLL